MPKIVTSLYELKHSGRMCPESWGTLLTGLGKTKAYHEPLDALDCLPIVGLQDTLWMLPMCPEFGDACRRLALSYALPGVHLADDPAAEDMLSELARYLTGDCSAAQVVAPVPPEHRPHTWYLISFGDSWDDYETPEAATLAAVMATYPDGSTAPYAVSRLVEVASMKASPTPDATRAAIRARHAGQLADFLSSTN